MVNGDAGCEMAMRLGRYAEAIAFTSGAREAAHRLRMRGMESLFLSQMAAMATRSGDLDASDRMSTEAITIAHGRRHPDHRGARSGGTSSRRFLRGNDDEAVDAARRAVDGFVATGGAGHTPSRWQSSAPWPSAGATSARRGEHYRVAYLDCAEPVTRGRSLSSPTAWPPWRWPKVMPSVQRCCSAPLNRSATPRVAARRAWRQTFRQQAPPLLAILGDDVFAAAVARGMAVEATIPRA